MPGKFFDWLDHRTGYRRLMEVMLLEHIPGGAKWRYVWGSVLAFVFMVQVVTGILLMTAYSPGDSTAWGSVYFIQYEMDFGWLIRGLHHFGSQTMVVLLGLHMLQVVIAGAHLPPREINWWLGILLMGLILGMSLTGYLLPWDQKGYWATRVATNIAGNIPFIGEFIQKVLVGGSEYGHHTLTRFYALHVGILPLLVIVLLVAHIAIFRRHGVTAPPGAQGMDYFWPKQAFRDLVVCLLVFGVMLGLVVFGGHGNKVETPATQEETSFYDDWAHAGRDGLGANLDAPADPDTQGYPARPEWYFLFLFQLLKYFEGEKVLLGTVIIPNGVMVFLFLLPLFGYGRMRKFGHFLGIVTVVMLLASVAMLTVLALAADSPEAWPMGLGGGTTEAKLFQKKTGDAAKEAQRAVQLASEGIPAEGAREVLRNDPLTRGSKLFEMHCAVCHKYTVQDGEPNHEGFYKGPFKASDLGDFGTYEWTRGLIDNPGHDNYFGLTKLEGMKKWRKKLEAERKKQQLAKEDIAEEEKDLDTIARFLSEQRLPVKDRNPELAKFGLAKFEDFGCSSCHPFGSGSPKNAPDLAGYASPDWIRLMIMSPGHPLRHGSKNEMPAFRPKPNESGPGAEVHELEFFTVVPDFPKGKLLHLSDVDRELIIRWMTRDFRVVFGGQSISAAPPRK